MSATCSECGGQAVYHPVEYVAVILDHIEMPFIALLSRLRRSGKRGGAIIALYTLLARLGLGTFIDTYDEKTLLLDQMLWEAARARGITLREFRLFGRANGTFVGTLPSGQEFYFYGVPLPRGKKVWWVNTKSVLTRKLRARGVPVPAGGVAWTMHGARALFAKLGKPLVVKPAVGSGSRHTTMHVVGVGALERAFKSAKQLSPAVVVEEELAGQVYRPTLVGGKLLGVLRRDQPCVWGDGVHTVEELVAEANKDPKRSGPHFSPIALSPDTDAELALQNLTRTSIPPRGQRVQLHPKINWALGGTTTDVTAQVHPDNKKLFEDIAALTQAPLLGIDFIVEDISQSWQSQEKCGVIECNDMPYFDNHHLPFYGEPRDIAGPVWDLFLSNS